MFLVVCNRESQLIYVLVMSWILLNLQKSLCEAANKATCKEQLESLPMQLYNRNSVESNGICFQPNRPTLFYIDRQSAVHFVSANVRKVVLMMMMMILQLRQCCRAAHWHFYGIQTTLITHRLASIEEFIHYQFSAKRLFGECTLRCPMKECAHQFPQSPYFRFQWSGQPH